MSVFINKNTGQFPIYIIDVEAVVGKFDLQNVPEPFALVYEPDTIPVANDNEIVLDDGLEIIGGKYFRKYLWRPMTEEEIALRDGPRLEREATFLAAIQEQVE